MKNLHALVANKTAKATNSMNNEYNVYCKLILYLANERNTKEYENNGNQGLLDIIKAKQKEIFLSIKPVNFLSKNNSRNRKHIQELREIRNQLIS